MRVEGLWSSPTCQEIGPRVIGADEQLIAEYYGVGPGDGHLAGCADCRARSARRCTD